MPKTVADIMDRNFFYASHLDSIPKVLEDMDQRHLSSAPFLDLEGRPLGVATVREIESSRNVEELADQLTASAVMVDQNTPIEVAARVLARSKADSLVLVDGHGVAVGAVTAVDLLRALLGFEVGHEPDDGEPWPPDRLWSTGHVLDLESVHRAPRAPGLILLGSGDAAGRMAWVEATENIRERLDEMLRLPQAEPQLEALLEEYPRSVTFRAFVVREPGRRARLLGALLAAMRQPGKLPPIAPS